MSIKDLPHVTVEQVLALRKTAIELEEELAVTKQARTAYRISLENLEASIPKIKADAVLEIKSYMVVGLMGESEDYEKALTMHLIKYRHR